VLRDGDCRNRTTWQVCLSVLLIGLVLYNPFLVLVSHTDGLTYQALARHRATVGASEMQHLASMQNENAQIEATVERICLELVVEKTEFPSHAFQVELLPQRPELTTSVWFRPPPTR
jgi:hypothetical protein